MENEAVIEYLAGRLDTSGHAVVLVERASANKLMKTLLVDEECESGLEAGAEIE